MPEYPAPLQARLSRSERRRRLMEELLGQTLQPEQTQVVSGRAVPYSPLQGIMKVAQAYLARKGIEGADAEQQKIADEFAQGRQKDMSTVTDLLTGREQTGGPLRNVDEYQQFQPAVEPDYLKAAITAGSSPYVQGTGMDKVAQAMLNARMRGQASQARPIPTSSGYYEQTSEGWKPMQDASGKPILPVPADVILAGERKTAETVGKGKGEKIVEKPKRESEIAAQTEKTSNLDELITKAKDQASGFTTTGFIGQLTKGVGGTPAHNLSNTLNTIKANIGFDKLQEMRANSPTGGALGQVSEMENQLLQQVWSSVEQSQTEEQLKENLERVRKQVKESWKRINAAYEKDYGKPYTGEVPKAVKEPPKVLKFDAQGNLIQ